MKITGVVTLALVTVTAWSAYAGHEAPLYPSYYPQEIRIEPIEPSAAARHLETGRIHAYVGREPSFAGMAPKSLRFVESLGSYLLVHVNPRSPAARDDQAVCEIASTVVQQLAVAGGRFVPHVYPVNGFHADFLHHADRADAANARFLAPEGSKIFGLKVRVIGPLAEHLAPPERVTSESAAWDVSIEEVNAAMLVAQHVFNINGWMGPPWLKAGWFHAYLLLAPMLADPAARELAARQLSRLQSGSFADAAERINEERGLVATLTNGCATVVAGYAVRREYYSDEYSEGIENVSHDSHAGLNSAIFLRTVKLKDFPWNGWLTIGVPTPFSAAWNPLGGFNDEPGRLLWRGIGDPALFPEPYGSSWILNRFGDVQANER